MEASVIIPTYNRLEQLHRCLEALSCQTYPATDFEVVVIVDGSTDGTIEMLAGLSAPFSLRVILQSNAGQPSALNRGLAVSAGRISIFLDDDIVVTPQFVAEHVYLHQKHELAVGIGQIKLELPPDADWFASGFSKNWREHYEELNRGKRQPEWDECYGGNMSVRRAVVLAVGGNVMDLRRGYDVDLAYRLKRYGCSFVYLPKALGNQYQSKGFQALARDSELAGEGSVELVRRHPDMEAKLFGHMIQTGWAWTFLWQLFFRINISTGGIERLRKFAGGHGDSYKWFVFVDHYYFWKGVCRAAPEQRGWKLLSHVQKRGDLA
jgi:glycosyltransferase involved in cell wall biosynthesis